MTLLTDIAEEQEPDSISNKYLVRLAEYRRRLTVLRDNLFRLNSLLDHEEGAPRADKPTRH